MNRWSEQEETHVLDAEHRHMSAGYNFGGYIPGEEYLPVRKKWGKQVAAAVVSLVTIVSLVLMVVL